MSIIIAPSILSANFAKLQEEVDSVCGSADSIHVDVMDGHFVPNVSFGAPVLKNVQCALPLDVHLMVKNPKDRFDEFLALGVANITFHAEVVEGTEQRMELIEYLHEKGCKAGIALNPNTPLEAVEDVLGSVDLLLIMSVEPGFGGQAFIEDVLTKVCAARSANPDLMIQMDGGITDETAGACIAAGANNLVSGSFIFGAPDRTLAVESLRTAS